MSEKYSLVKSERTHPLTGKNLYDIVAERDIKTHHISKGDRGGTVESPKALSGYDDSWISEGCMVLGYETEIHGNVLVTGSSVISNSTIHADRRRRISGSFIKDSYVGNFSVVNSVVLDTTVGDVEKGVTCSTIAPSVKPGFATPYFSCAGELDGVGVDSSRPMVQVHKGSHSALLYYAIHNIADRCKTWAFRDDPEKVLLSLLKDGVVVVRRTPVNRIKLDCQDHSFEGWERYYKSMSRREVALSKREYRDRVRTVYGLMRIASYWPNIKVRGWMQNHDLMYREDV